MNDEPPKPTKEAHVFVDPQGYKCMANSDTVIRLHRTIWQTHYGEIPPGWEVHHIDGNKANNMLENLLCLPRAEHRKLHNELRKHRRNNPDNPV